MPTPKEVYESDVYKTLAESPHYSVGWVWFKDVYDALGMALQPTPETHCVWSQDDAYDGDGNWNTSCGEMFVFIDDTPKGNGMKFCCHCGSRLIEKLYEPEPDEDA